MHGLMPRMFFAFTHACHTRVSFKLKVICTVHSFLITKFVLASVSDTGVNYFGDNTAKNISACVLTSSFMLNR